VSAPRYQRRWWVLGPMLIMAALLALFGDKTPPQQSTLVARPVERTATASPAAPTANAQRPQPSEDLAELRPREELLASTAPGALDPFGVRNWTPPPPSQPEIMPLAPTAPPLPYVYAGRKQEGGAWEVYLLRGETALLVREGATLDGTYVVVAIKPPTMTLKYLPLGQQQTLAIGEVD
jgi:hypothetical protein